MENIPSTICFLVGGANMKLSIIIPYYNTLPYTINLLKKLEKQMTDEVEIILVDDGCHELGLYTLLDYGLFKNGGVHINTLMLPENEGLSVARNVGFENSKGDYIVYIDSDDNVSNDYIKTILHKINEVDFDCCYFGWKAINQNLTVYIDDKPPLWNWAVWNAVYKRDLIEQFEGRKFEDVSWQQKMRPKFKKIEHIHKILYYYNNGREGSITDLHSKGLN